MSDPAVPSFDISAPVSETSSGDFADTMQQLAHEAEGHRPAPVVAVSKAAKAEFLMVIGQMIRPLAVGVEDLNERLGKLVATQAATKAPDLGPIHATLETVRGQLGRMGNVESANQKLFDALHTELKGYKDGFLFDSLQKPFVRDLIALFDDLSTLAAQIEARQLQTGSGGGEGEFLNIFGQNFDNACHGLLETFERLDVERHETAPGEPVDKRVHRVIAFEPAPEAVQEGCVARSLRPGFTWRGRSVRPEEIIAWRWPVPNSTPADLVPPVMTPNL